MRGDEGVDADPIARRYVLVRVVDALDVLELPRHAPQVHAARLCGGE